MIIAVLRVDNMNIDVKKFIEKHELEIDAMFENGFNLCLFDEDKITRDQFNQYISKAIADYEEVFDDLRENGINSEIDIGVTVSKDDQFTYSLALPTEIIKKISKYNIDVVFSAYPSSK